LGRRAEVCSGSYALARALRESGAAFCQVTPCYAGLILLIYLGEIQMTAELIAQLAALFLILGAGPIIVVLLYVRGGNL